MFHIRVQTHERAHRAVYYICSFGGLCGNDGLRRTSCSAYSRGQRKLQACREVWNCTPIITVSVITGTSLHTAAEC